MKVKANSGNLWKVAFCNSEQKATRTPSLGIATRSFSCVAYVGRVCHCHCGGDRSSRHPVRLVWVNGSFGCRTIAARTRDLILDTEAVPRTPWLGYGLRSTNPMHGREDAR